MKVNKVVTLSIEMTQKEALEFISSIRTISESANAIEENVHRENSAVIRDAKIIIEHSISLMRLHNDIINAID